MSTKLWTCGLLVTLLGFAAPQLSRAQALVQGSVAATQSGGQTSPTFGGAVTYRFNRALGLGVEASHIRGFSDGRFPRLYCCDEKGHATVFTTNVRVEIPTLSKKVIPFVVGGGGVASVTDYYSVVYAAADLSAELTALLGTNLVSPIYGGPNTLSYATTSMALTLGGGASILLTDHFAVDADLRVLHLMGDSTRTVGRFGTGVSYRF